MARKTKEDTEQTHTALLDAAEQVFFDKGVARTTLADIASAAGMTRGAIYWHFTDKADLLRRLFARAMLPMEAMLDELMRTSDTDPLNTLRHLCITALTTLAQSPRQQRAMGILFHKCESTGDVASVMQQELADRDECLAEIATIMAKAVTMGQLPADTDVPLTVQTLHNFMIGTMHEWLLDPKRYALDKAAPGMVDLLMAGLRACPPRVASMTS
jgi:TetR/AcrR family acrAB operon transcriptional repressor